MPATLTTKPVPDVVAAIHTLDLESVKARVMDPELGEGWSREYADSIEAAYKTYLTMLVKYPEHAEDILLSTDVDEFWHTHILQTMKYANDCQALFGNFLHHEPHVGERTAADLEKRVALAETTRVLYQREFGSARAAVAWAGTAGKAAPAEAAFSNASIQGANAAFSNASVRAENAAFSNATVGTPNAAFSNAAIQAGTAAFSNASVKAETASIGAGSAAFSNATIRAPNAAFSNAAIRAGRAAFSNASIGAANAAFSNATIAAPNAAFSNASIAADKAAFSNAAITARDAAFSNASISVHAGEPAPAVAAAGARRT